MDIVKLPLGQRQRMGTDPDKFLHLITLLKSHSKEFGLYPKTSGKSLVLSQVVCSAPPPPS